MRAAHFRHLAKYRRDILAAAALLWIVSHSWHLGLALIQREAFNALTGATTVTQLGPYALILLMLAAQVSGSLIGRAWIYFNQRWFAYLEALLSHNLFAWILDRNPDSRLPGAPGEAVSRFRNDIPGTYHVLNEWYRLPGEGIYALGALIIMYQIEPMVTLVAVLPLASVVVVTHRMGARLEAYAEASRRDTGRITGYIGETFSAVQAVKVADAEESVLAHFKELNRQRHRSFLKFLLIDQLISAFNSNIGDFGRALVIILAAKGLHAGTFTVGDFVLFTTYLGELLEFPRRFGRLLAARKVADVAAARVQDLVPTAPAAELVRHRPIDLKHADEPAQQPPAPPQALSRFACRALTYQYPQSDKGIEAASFAVDPGQLVVITGQVGAGKSTLLKALLGLLPAQGQILWNDHPIDDPRCFLVPPNTAYVPQTPRLFSESLQENIVLGWPCDPAQIDRAVEAAVLTDDIQRLEQGLETAVGPRGVRLSGGQVQRAAAARALVRQPRLLVVDDLSSALDVDTEGRLWENIAALRTNQGSACIAVSHRKVAWRLADRILVLKEGRIDGAGTLAELLQTNAEMQRLWRDEGPSSRPSAD
ncbi:MAG: ATP-binding cassette domain-containing protein [Candidatus Latescibacteria bacterium]|nr:ATP-binding cassette domain-containing protein [Candidatus Latescibacterota bacterium]